MSTSDHHAKCLQRDLDAARVRIAQLERRVEQSDITDDERLDEIASGQADLVKAGREMLNLCNKLELCQAELEGSQRLNVRRPQAINQLCANVRQIEVTLEKDIPWDESDPHPVYTQTHELWESISRLNNSPA